MSDDLIDFRSGVATLRRRSRMLVAAAIPRSGGGHYLRDGDAAPTSPARPLCCSRHLPSPRAVTPTSTPKYRIAHSASILRQAGQAVVPGSFEEIS